MSDSAHETVGAVIVTFRRPRVLMETLGGVLAQSADVYRIVVVDNDADPEIELELARLAPDVTYVAAPGNGGFAVGLAIGIDRLRTEVAPDWFWLLDDDSPPDTAALESAMDVAGLLATSGPRQVGVVANRGGHVTRGRIRHDLGQQPGRTTPAPADFALVDGALVAASAVRAVGLPRLDLFMMFEDIEYTTRIRSAGFLLVVRPGDSSTFLHLGSTASWRGYYQARNHLRVAIDLRKWSWVWGWFVRETGIGLNLLVQRRFGALRLRWRGAFDGLRNKMGKVVDPA